MVKRTNTVITSGSVEDFKLNNDSFKNNLKSVACLTNLEHVNILSNVTEITLCEHTGICG